MAVVVGIAFLTAGCGSSPSSRATQQTGWVAFSSCMRSNGVASYPDPDRSGRPPKESLQQLGVSSARLQSAEVACRHLLPNGGRPPSAAEQHQVAETALRFSQCIRAHGVANFPDPGSDGQIPDPATVGIDQGSPKFQAANTACGRYRPPYMPSNAAFNAYARTQTG